jgi:hypothetical protein
MSRRHRWAIRVFVIALFLASSVSAGITPASVKPPPVEPIAQLLNYLRKSDPSGRMVRNVLYGETSDEAKIVVSNVFHQMPYQG